MLFNQSDSLEIRVCFVLHPCFEKRMLFGGRSKTVLDIVVGKWERNRITSKKNEKEGVSCCDFSLNEQKTTCSKNQNCFIPSSIGQSIIHPNGQNQPLVLFSSGWSFQNNSRLFHWQSRLISNIQPTNNENQELVS